VLAAGSGDEAVNLLEGHPAQVDLLLTDVVMPGLSGSALAARLTATYPAMRVLYMSGYTDDAIMHDGVLDPGTAFLQKPFTPDQLAAKVAEVLTNQA
jgi:two-component system cell cycle sensor histidine kinase/response regulator CckA